MNQCFVIWVKFMSSLFSTVTKDGALKSSILTRHIGVMLVDKARASHALYCVDYFDQNQK